MNDSDPATKEETGSDPAVRDRGHVDELAATEYATGPNGSGGSSRPSGTESLAAFEELGERTIGDFRVLRRLGVGGMAEVYLAEQISLKRNVALKVLRAEVLSGSDDVLLRRFEQEARAAASLTHQNIVQVYGVGADHGLHWIAQEYVRGINLKQFMNRKGPPDAALAVRLAKQVALALRAAGDAGIVHRDVKPENVMVTPKGRVKVADFGLAQLTRDENLQLTQVGMTMGTPLYMSPEQVNGQQTDGRSDLYSFGVTLYHLLAGDPPFRGETALAVAVKHLNEDPPRLHDVRSDLPRSLCDLVHRLMAKSPADRPSDAGEVYEELKRIGQAVSDGASGVDIDPAHQPVAAGTGWPAASRRDLRRQLAMFAGACLLVGTLSAAIGWIARPGNPLDTPPAASAIPREASVDDQMWVAIRLGTEEAWQAVVDHFGDDPAARRDVARAKLRLGLFALTDRRFDEARRRFDDVYTEHETDRGLRANAIAGLAAVDSLTGDHAASQNQIVVELQPIRGELDREMQNLVEQTIRRNREHLGGSVADGLEDLFRQNEPTFE